MCHEWWQLEAWVGQLDIDQLIGDRQKFLGFIRAILLGAPFLSQPEPPDPTQYSQGVANPKRM